jgi:hypothetical protein
MAAGFEKVPDASHGRAPPLSHSHLVCTQNISRMAIPLVEKYKGALTRLSARTGTSVPSLCASFLILHEVTAIIPFIGVFYASRGLGVGEKVVDMVLDGDSDVAGSQPGWARSKPRQWVEEGGQFAERVGRRYGMFGYEKRSAPQSGIPTAELDPLPAVNLGGKVAGDVANAIVAYGVVKVRRSTLHVQYVYTKICLSGYPTVAYGTVVIPFSALFAYGLRAGSAKIPQV